ncbi:uncharacterized protein [Nicotiana sylvestris]|uniref:uncharacterized protein n=1 Tax=Nicotiana sylvestris TaxID=4096 RepID=UPI00388C9081
MAIGEEVSAGTSTGTTTTTINHHHPLFLQLSDIPGSSLISIQLTRTENYALWSRSIKIGLISKCKLAFVDRRCTKDKFDPSLHELWEKCNAIVLSWIMNAVSNELLSGIVYKSSAHKVWTDLKANMIKWMNLVFSFYIKKLQLYRKEFLLLLQFLMGLNEIYAQPRSQILMMSPVPSVNKAYSIVISEESQRSLGKFAQALDIGDSTTLFTNKEDMTIDNNYKPRRNNLFSDFCNYKGHTRETCYKIHGYPTDFKMRKKANNFPQRPMVNTTTHEAQQLMGKAAANAVSQEEQQMLNSPVANPTLPQLIMFTQEQYDQILKLISKDECDKSKHFAGTTKATTTPDKTKNENWIVDSGATNHMVHTGELHDKINIDSLKSASKVHLPDDTSLDIACTGESKIGEYGVITNIIQDLHNGKVKGIGKDLDGLYNLQYQKDKNKAADVQAHGDSKKEEDLGI